MPDFWFYGILNFLKKGRGSSNFRKIRAIVLKLHTNTLHRSRNFGIEFGQNRLKRSNFFRFWIFWEFFQNCLTQTNFDLSSLNFVSKCTNTEWCLIPNFIKIGGDLSILDEFDFLNFLSWHQIIKIRCIHEAFSMRKPKSSNVLPWRKNFGKSVRKQYGNPDSHPFLYYWSHTYIKFHTFYMHKISYTFISIFKNVFFAVYLL